MSTENLKAKQKGKLWPQTKLFVLETQINPILSEDFCTQILTEIKAKKTSCENFLYTCMYFLLCINMVKLKKKCVWCGGGWVWGCVCVKKGATKRGRELPCKKELNPRAGKLRAVQVRKETFKSTLWTDFKAWNKWRWKGYRQRKKLNILPQLLSFPWLQ